MTYTIEPRNKFFQAFCSLPEREIRPGLAVTFTSLVDLTQVEEIRAATPPERDDKCSYTAFVLGALALGLREFPYANRRVYRLPWAPFLGPRLQAFHSVDIGVAVERNVNSVESVTFVDILRHADRCTLLEINNWLQTLADCDDQSNAQWRTMSTLIRRYPSVISTLLMRVPCWVPAMWAKYRGAAALVSSPGKYGVDNIVGTWNWPLGISFGHVRPRPVVLDGMVVARPTFNLSMSFDRRIMAGAQAARFFKRVVDILQNPRTELASALMSPGTRAGHVATSS